jgi:hypothetical protein
LAQAGIDVASKLNKLSDAMGWSLSFSATTAPSESIESLWWEFLGIARFDVLAAKVRPL